MISQVHVMHIDLYFQMILSPFLCIVSSLGVSPDEHGSFQLILVQ